jgi:hypothetical protein
MNFWIFLLIRSSQETMFHNCFRSQYLWHHASATGGVVQNGVANWLVCCGGVTAVTV